jgi:hypothetical protein
LAQRKDRATASVRKKAAEPNGHEATRQGVKEKTAKELPRRYGHQLLLAFVRIVFATETIMAR